MDLVKEIYGKLDGNGMADFIIEHSKNFKEIILRELVVAEDGLAAKLKPESPDYARLVKSIAKRLEEIKVLK